MIKPLRSLTAFLLKYVDPHKPYGTQLFDAIARVSVSVAFEAVALRRNPETGDKEVYLVQRAPDDIAYPGQWHVPGSVLRPAEKDEHVLHRLSKREFGVPIVASKFVALLNHPGEERGHFIGLVYRVKLGGEPTKGRWFPLDKLPKETVRFHRTHIIPIAARDYKFEDVQEVRIKALEL